MTAIELASLIMSSSDKSLVAAVRSGDERAAEELYERYAARVFGLVRTQMGDHLYLRTDPEDIVQSVFKSIFRGMSTGGYDAPDGGSLWHLMAVIAVNKVRRNATRQAASKRDARRTEALIDDQQAVIEKPSLSQIESAIHEAIECLEPSEREVVLLRVRGHSVEEIADQLGKSRRTVERLLQHARRTLAKELHIGEDDESIS